MMFPPVAKRKRKRHNYPEGRKSASRIVTFLTNSPVGCVIKIIIILVWEAADGFNHTTRTREFTKAGLSKPRFRQLVERKCPAIPLWYIEQGSFFSDNIAWKRGYQGAAYSNEGVKGDPDRRDVIPDEHYTRSEDLIPFADETIALFVSKEVITMEDIKEVVKKVKGE